MSSAHARPATRGLRGAVLALAGFALAGFALAAAGAGVRPQAAGSRLDLRVRPELAEATRLINVDVVRETFQVDGSGLAVAVLDTGVRASHVDFGDRVLPGRNFTNANGGDPDDVSDIDGHGTHVAGVIAANGIHVGVAPGASVVPLLVTRANGAIDFDAVLEALRWVSANRERLNITVVNMSFVDGENLRSFDDPEDEVAQELRALREAGVVCVAAAGNNFFGFDSEQGMGFPAIVPEVLSVGAVYDADVGRLDHPTGAIAFSTAPKRICSFSQRLSEQAGGAFATDIFAPGSPVTSTGSRSNDDSAILQGTSEATPAVSGVVLLMQEYYLREKGHLPTVQEIEDWLFGDAVPIRDGDDEDDNVDNTGDSFRMVDAFRALREMVKALDGGNTYTIRGAVKLGRRGLGGVKLRAGITTAVTRANGKFQLTGLVKGTYTLTPERDGYEFTPPSAIVTVGPDQKVKITARKERPPKAPTNLRARAVSSTSILLTWRDRSDNEDGFIIEQKAGNRFVEVGRVGADVTEITITSAQPNTTYQFRLRAFNLGGASAPSNTAKVRTPR